MGVAYYPVFNDQPKEWSDDINGKCLAKASSKLDAACKKEGVPTLGDFFSMSREQMIAELLDGDPDDPTTYDATKLPEEHWFDASAGLVTLKVLIKFVRENANHFNKFDTVDLPNCVLEDLEAFERQLSQAADRDIRWHLSIDY